MDCAMDCKDHSTGNSPLDCPILLSRVLDNFIPGTHSEIQKGVFDIQRASPLQPQLMWLKVLLGFPSTTAVLQGSVHFHLTGSVLALRESGSLMLAWAASCFPWSTGSHRSTEICCLSFPLHLSLFQVLSNQLWRETQWLWPFMQW